ncbi:hypothetical protein Q7P37_000758 [Cladosporium fusiforme]
MGLLQFASEAGSVALVTASWASELFLAALFLRVVILPSTSQANARFWTALSSHDSQTTLLVVEDAYDRAVDSWILQPVQGLTRKLAVKRQKTLDWLKVTLHWTKDTYRSVRGHFHNAALPQPPWRHVRPPANNPGVRYQMLVDAWSVFYRTLAIIVLIVESPVHGLVLIGIVKVHTPPPNTEHVQQAETPPSGSRPAPSVANKGNPFDSLPRPRKSYITLTPRYDLRLKTAGLRSTVKFPSPKRTKRKRSLHVDTGWGPKDLQPENWRQSPLRQGIGFFKRRAGMHSPRFRRVVLLNRLRPSKISSPLRGEREAHIGDEPDTPILSRHKSTFTSEYSKSPRSDPPDTSARPQVSENDLPDTSEQSQDSHTGSQEQTTAESPEEEENRLLRDMYERLKTPLPVIFDLNLRDPQRVLTASDLHYLQEVLVAIHGQYVAVRTEPEQASFTQVKGLRDDLRAIADTLVLFGHAEDLTSFNMLFFDSLVGVVESLIAHSSLTMDWYAHDHAMKSMSRRSIGYAQTISSELAHARSMVILQRMERGYAQVEIGGELVTVGEV